MQSLDDLLTDYNRIHTHPVNRALHALGIPLVMLGSLGLLALLPAPQVFGHVLDPMSLGITASTLLFARWSWRLAIGIQLAQLSAFSMLCMLLGMLDLSSSWLAVICASSVVIGSLLHTIGHRLFEREAAQFDQKPEFLLAGPLALAEDIHRRTSKAGVARHR